MYNKKTSINKVVGKKQQPRTRLNPYRILMVSVLPPVGCFLLLAAAGRAGTAEDDDEEDVDEEDWLALSKSCTLNACCRRVAGGILGPPTLVASRNWLMRLDTSTESSLPLLAVVTTTGFLAASRFLV